MHACMRACCRVAVDSDIMNGPNVKCKPAIGGYVRVSHAYAWYPKVCTYGVSFHG